MQIGGIGQGMVEGLAANRQAADQAQIMRMRQMAMDQEKQNLANQEAVDKAAYAALSGGMQPQRQSAPMFPPPQNMPPPQQAQPIAPPQVNLPPQPAMMPQSMPQQAPQAGMMPPQGMQMRPPMPQQTPMPGQPSQPMIQPKPTIPPYNTVQGMQQRAQQQVPMSQAAPMGPPPVGQQQAQGQDQPFSLQSVIANINRQYPNMPDNLKLQALSKVEPYLNSQDKAQLAALKMQLDLQQKGLQADNIKSMIDKRNFDMKNKVGVPGNEIAPKTTEDFYKIAGKFGMTPSGFEKAVDSYNKSGMLPPNVRSLKSLPLTTAIMNRAAEKYPESDVASNKVEYQGDTLAYKQTVSREAAVNRTIGAVKENQPRIEALVNKLNTSLGGQFKNKTMNELIAKFGDNADLQELRNLIYAASREYVIATTMPGSNAQMHTTHAEDADKMLNMNMPPAQFAGAFKGINEDMTASQKALDNEQKRLMGKIKGIGKSETPASGTVLKFDSQGNLIQ